MTRGVHPLLRNGIPPNRAHRDKHTLARRSPSSQLALQRTDIPDSFDARDRWKGLISAPQDQGQCGDCYAFATTGSFTDRISITLNAAAPLLSAQWVTVCMKSDMLQGCDGGNVQAAFQSMTENTVPTASFIPFSETGTSTSRCGKVKYGWRGDSAHTIADKDMGSDSARVKAIQREIISNGPVVALMKVTEDFMTWWVSDKSASDVYIETPHSKEDGNHAVVLLGWGTKGGVDYWTVRNSWGTKTGGDGGYFRIRRGSNESEIETSVSAIDISRASAEAGKSGTQKIVIGNIPPGNDQLSIGAMVGIALVVLLLICLVSLLLR